ncbi:MAG: DUF4245 domain-containing protein [Actinomycetales bacterium]|nr:DUF4245 domain-containing protein [Actinomycetales bacterium]
MAEDAAAKRRARQTIRNLVLSLLACLGIVLLTVLAVPRDESVRIDKVDYKAVAADASASTGYDLLVPNLPEGWWSNKAEWSGKSADGVQTWYLGMISPNNKYVGMTVAFNANPTWFVGQLGEGAAALGPKYVGNGWWQWDAVPQHDPMKTTDHVWTFGTKSIEGATGQVIMLYGAESIKDFYTIAESVPIPSAVIHDTDWTK